ncbi:MAG TPA: hypothetical protein VLK22_04300 [Candidatus Udaeobacter sp.]|nr:hypothetical protein [Candidatus Udaeobacter sp.]
MTRFLRQLVIIGMALLLVGSCGSHRNHPINVHRLCDHNSATAQLRPSEAAVSPENLLTYRGGRLLTSVVVQPIFWGSVAWSSPQINTVPKKIADFFAAILKKGSVFNAQLAEYSLSGRPQFGPGSLLASVVVNSSPPKRVSDAAIRTALAGWIRQGVVAATRQQTFYAIYLPPGTVSVNGREMSCRDYCGYHDSFVSNGVSVFYAVLPYPSCQGCLPRVSFERLLDPASALMVVSSHELAEGQTDPIPGEGWYNDINGENGDYCVGQIRQEGNFFIQKEWSNRAGACL